MPNRYCRDELIKIALNMAQLPNLDIHDIPGGIVQSDAFSLQWLQDILDFWHHMVPFSATVVYVSLNATAHQDYITLPSDFILDVRNGYLTQSVVGDVHSLKRRVRMPLQKFINRQLVAQTTTDINSPLFYCVVGDNSDGKQLMKITPTPTIDTVGYLWYYQLPAMLNSSDKPKFPNDYVCIEYIRIRALEWARVYDPGTAHRFTDKIVGGMKAAGLMNEPEDDEIPFDNLVYSKNNSNWNTYSWMGQR